MLVMGGLLTTPSEVSVTSRDMVPLLLCTFTPSVNPLDPAEDCIDSCTVTVFVTCVVRRAVGTAPVVVSWLVWRGCVEQGVGNVNPLKVMIEGIIECRVMPCSRCCKLMIDIQRSECEVTLQLDREEDNDLHFW